MVYNEQFHFILFELKSFIINFWLTNLFWVILKKNNFPSKVWFLRFLYTYWPIIGDKVAKAKIIDFSTCKGLQRLFDEFSLSQKKYPYVFVLRGAGRKLEWKEKYFWAASARFSKASTYWVSTFLNTLCWRFLQRLHSYWATAHIVSLLRWRFAFKLFFIFEEY